MIPPGATYTIDAVVIACDLVTTMALCMTNRVHNGNSCSKSGNEQK